ncbi:hypothetical thioredoxin peroxidase [Burkholderia dolosa AU0158]|nr:hypothetical thioredoxin peroxidase [Burkholderia dolosa AU0158]
MRTQMKRKLWMTGAAMMLAGHALIAHAQLKPGAAAPDFTTQASLGGKTYTYSLADALKHGPVVLYFYPAAFTKGCTIEAHAFADAVDRYKAYGATVIGVSADNIDTLTKFSVSECRSKFPVAARSGREDHPRIRCEAARARPREPRVLRDFAGREDPVRVHEPCRRTSTSRTRWPR